MRPEDEGARHPNTSLEDHLVRAKLGPVCGIDEAGRGSWAGPVVAAAVILPIPSHDLQRRFDGVRDSKRLSARQRERWSLIIRENCLSFGIGKASHAVIDRIGIVPATRLAMMRAVQELDPAPSYLLLDYMLLPELCLPQTSLPHGDAHVLSIAAASILAKVARDNLMVEFNRSYPHYGFDRHKGYGTQRHREELQAHGPCAIHRQSYSPVKQVSTRMKGGLDTRARSPQ